MYVRDSRSKKLDIMPGKESYLEICPFVHINQSQTAQFTWHSRRNIVYKYANSIHKVAQLIR